MFHFQLVLNGCVAGLTSNVKRGTGKKKRRAVRARGAEEEYVLEDKPPPPTLGSYGIAFKRFNLF